LAITEKVEVEEMSQILSRSWNPNRSQSLVLILE
jgi:hypothetical protein